MDLQCSGDREGDKEKALEVHPGGILLIKRHSNLQLRIFCVLEVT